MVGLLRCFLESLDHEGSIGCEACAAIADARRRVQSRIRFTPRPLPRFFAASQLSWLQPNTTLTSGWRPSTLRGAQGDASRLDFRALWSETSRQPPPLAAAEGQPSTQYKLGR